MLQELKNGNISDRRYVTGVRNRRSLLAPITVELNEAKAYKNDLSLVLIDLDNFKEINIAMSVGTIYSNLCEHVSKSIRKTDTFGRYGGEVHSVA